MEKGRPTSAAQRPADTRPVEASVSSTQSGPPLRVLDLFSGLGGFSQAFADRGHVVTRIDDDRRFEEVPHTIIRDVRQFVGTADLYDVVLAAPPCTEFSRESMPWSRTGVRPSTDLVWAAKPNIDESRPRWWVIENVRGSMRYLDPIFGEHRRYGSRYLWGDFPEFECDLSAHSRKKWYMSPSPDRPALRSKIEYELSEALCLAIEGESARTS